MKREIHLISDGKRSLADFTAIAKEVHPQVTAIHIREKSLPAKKIAAWTEELLSHGVPKEKIYINDRVDVAVAFDVKGVQLAHHSLSPNQVKQVFPSLRVGRSVHSLEEAVVAQQLGADYLLFGHIFPTNSKVGLPPKGLTQLAEIVQSVTIPVIAIGGITPSNTANVLQTGASGIAILSGILSAENPIVSAKLYREEVS